MLVENTREEALKAFVNGSDVRMAVNTVIGEMRFIRLNEALPQDAIYFIEVDVRPEDDYEEKVLRSDQEVSENATLDVKQKDSLQERDPIGEEQEQPVAERKPKAAAKPKTEKKAKPKQKTARDIIEPYVKQGLTDSEIAEKTGIKYGTVWTAAKKIREKLEETKGKNADRHLCKTCQYRASDYSRGNYKPKCEYSLKPGTGNSRGCDVEDCDKYVKGNPLKAEKSTEV